MNQVCMRTVEIFNDKIPSTTSIKCSDKTLKTILRIRPAISNIENDDMISVDSPTSVLVKPEGKNRVDKYSFTKGKPTQIKILSYIVPE